MTNKQFFYGRVSTREQNAERQIKAAKDFGIDERQRNGRSCEERNADSIGESNDKDVRW